MKEKKSQPKIGGVTAQKWRENEIAALLRVVCHGPEQCLILGNDGEGAAEPFVLPLGGLLCLCSSFPKGQTVQERRRSFKNNSDLVMTLQGRFLEQHWMPLIPEKNRSQPHWDAFPAPDTEVTREIPEHASRKRQKIPKFSIKEESRRAELCQDDQVEKLLWLSSLSHGTAPPILSCPQLQHLFPTLGRTAPFPLPSLQTLQ